MDFFTMIPSETLFVDYSGNFILELPQKRLLWIPSEVSPGTPCGP